MSFSHDAVLLFVYIILLSIVRRLQCGARCNSESSLPKTHSAEILLDGQVSDDSIKVCVGSKYLPDGRKSLNKVEHFSLNFVQKRLSNGCVTVSVDVDENKDCVTRSGGETGPGRR